MIMIGPNRIVLNTLATYGRSLLSLVCGLFSARWVLAALGKDDFGLYGVIGTMVVLVGLLNGILSAAVARYYAYAIGEASKMDFDVGNEVVSRWFNAAFSVHIILPIVLIAIGYPLGVYAIHHWLNIPNGRMIASIWVFRLSLVLAFVHMISVPYIAMYRAKQLIAELSLWGILSTIGTFICAYMLLTWEGDRLIAYAGFMTVIPTVIALIQVCRARAQFNVCHLRLQYMFALSYVKRLFLFAFGEFFGWLGGAIRDHGMAFLINIKFGTGVNAAYNISNQVSGQTTALSSAMIGALMPAVTSAEGAGNHDRAMRLSFQGIKFGVLLILLFCVPLILEVDYVLSLWLVAPPDHTAIFCRCILVALVFHKLGWGHHLAILANGDIVAYQATAGITAACGLLFAWVFVVVGLGVWGIGLSFIITFALLTIVRVVFARNICDMPIFYWLKSVVLPLLIIIVISFLAGLLIMNTLRSSFMRVVLLSFVTSSIMLIVSWFVVCDDEERSYVRQISYAGVSLLRKCMPDRKDAES